MKQEVRGMTNDKQLLNFVENEILKHKEDYSEKEITKLLEIFNEIMNIAPKKGNNIENMYINFIGSNHMAVYYLKHIWTMKLLIKILEYSTKNSERTIFCLTVLNNLYYFVLGDSDKFSKDEYWSEFRKVKKLLYPYSDKFYDELVEKYENMNSENLNEISDSNKEIEEIKEINEKTEQKKSIEKLPKKQ